jgi:hypothetical protein
MSYCLVNEAQRKLYVTVTVFEVFTVAGNGDYGIISIGSVVNLGADECEGQSWCFSVVIWNCIPVIRVSILVPIIALVLLNC